MRSYLLHHKLTLYKFIVIVSPNLCSHIRPVTAERLHSCLIFNKRKNKQFLRVSSAKVYNGHTRIYGCIRCHPMPSLQRAKELNTTNLQPGSS